MSMEQRNEQAEAIRRETVQAEAPARPEKADYLERIKGLSAEDQAFMDGYLFAKVTSRREPA